jgi:DNA-binding MarR family transcriptional regulator
MSGVPGSPRAALIAALNAAMREVNGQGVRFSNAVAARLGINTTDLECLGYLVDGPVTAGRLAEATGLSTGAITGVIDRLERAGFARRERDKTDRRKVLVHATAPAIERAGQLQAPMEAATLAALAPCDDEQLALLLGFLGRTRDAAQKALAEIGVKAPRAHP